MREGSFPNRTCPGRALAPWAKEDLNLDVFVKGFDEYVYFDEDFNEGIDEHDGGREGEGQEAAERLQGGRPGMQKKGGKAAKEGIPQGMRSRST